MNPSSRTGITGWGSENAPKRANHAPDFPRTQANDEPLTRKKTCFSLIFRYDSTAIRPSGSHFPHLIMRILLVEDYGPLRLSIAQRLREDGYQVDETTDGGEAFWLARENDYALVLLDLMLPGIDGMRILEDIRTRGADSSILIMTARDAVPDRV